MNFSQRKFSRTLQQLAHSGDARFVSKRFTRIRLTVCTTRSRPENVSSAIYAPRSRQVLYARPPRPGTAGTTGKRYEPHAHARHEYGDELMEKFARRWHVWAVSPPKFRAHELNANRFTECVYSGSVTMWRR